MRSRLQLIALALALILVVGICLFYRVYIRGMWYPRSYVVSLGDLDGNGDLDAFVGNGHTDDTGSPNTVWLNDGTGRFLDSGQRLSHSNGYVVNVGDVDGDGDADVFATHYDRRYRVWYNDGTGHFGQGSGWATIPICLATSGVVVLGLCLLGWRAWVPFSIMAAIALLITRSLRPVLGFALPLSYRSTVHLEGLEPPTTSL